MVTVEESLLLIPLLFAMDPAAVLFLSLIFMSVLDRADGLGVGLLIPYLLSQLVASDNKASYGFEWIILLHGIH